MHPNIFCPSFLSRLDSEVPTCQLLLCAYEQDTLPLRFKHVRFGIRDPRVKSHILPIRSLLGI